MSQTRLPCCCPGCQENSLNSGDSNIRATVRICIPWLSGSLSQVREVGVQHSGVISHLAGELKATSCCDSCHCPRTPHMTHMPGLAPAIKTMRRAMRLCKFHFSTAAATQMTPTNSSVVFLKYSAATCREVRKAGHQPRRGHGRYSVFSESEAREAGAGGGFIQITGYLLIFFSSEINPRDFPMLGKHSTTR